MDPWYPLGSHDMLEVAKMALHVGLLTGVEEMKSCFDSVTTSAAQVLNLENYGIATGKQADLIILQAADAIEALRLQAERLYVIRRGKVLAQAAPRTSTITMGETTSTVDFARAGLA
jgi:cytosine deaminase